MEVGFRDQRSFVHARCIFAFAAMLISQTAVPATPLADEKVLELLRAFVFPRSVESSARTQAFEYLERGYRFESLQEINEFNVRGSHPIPNSAHSLQLNYMPLESPFRASLRAGKGADNFIDRLWEILSASPAAHASNSRREERNPLEKLLAQRDLYQIYTLGFRAREHVADSKRELADRVLFTLSRMIRTTIFTQQEYHVLLDTRPRTTPTGFTRAVTQSLMDDYLPQVITQHDPSWIKLTNRGTPFRHFVDYGARSFVTVYVRAEGAKSEHLQALRVKLFEKYGETLHRSAIKESVPKGLETVLVRTIGVILDDGTYRNSHWPEEVLVRAFKYPSAVIDLQTSDFSGTLFYQYKLAREHLAREPGSLGLVRVRDDDPQFFGFFGDVSDPHNSYSNSTSTMRHNCIACHSELFYGLSTIFSFERDPEFESLRDDNELWKEVREGIYLLLTPENLSLEKNFRHH
jgi:hypothetical protein